MSNSTNICRLCKRTKNLICLFDMDDDMELNIKITSCINLKLSRDDDLPSMICKKCKKKVHNFFNFKQKCLEVDLEFRMAKNSRELEEQNDLENIPLWDYLDNDNNTDFADIPILDDEESRSQSDLNIDLSFNKKEESTPLQCELCGSMFNTNAELRRHANTHREKKIYHCTHCPKTFARGENLTIHMRSSHYGIRPYICEICGQTSTKSQDLVRHMKIHTDERNHECYICGRKFKRSSDLCSHIRTHSGIRPYKCKICGKDYTSNGGLRKHSSKHNKYKSYNLRTEYV